MSGSVTVKGDGTVALKETDGIDFSPVTVKASWPNSCWHAWLKNTGVAGSCCRTPSL
jgi:hypothetical protein